MNGATQIVDDAATPPPGPIEAVREDERITALDVARGFALLGIFMVNIQLFAAPFGHMIIPGPMAGSSTWDAAAYYFMMIFCMGKFYPLFSTLFGIGFVIQLDRARTAGRAFAPAYLRRLGILFVLGLIHGVLLWYGDILLLYSICGLVLFAFLMIFRNATPKLLAGVGVGLILFAFVTGVGIGMLAGGASVNVTSEVEPTDSGPATAPATLPATQPAPAGPTSAIATLFTELGDGTLQGGPEHPRWMQLETQAYQEGPYLDSLAFRALTFAIALVAALVNFGWSVLGMFFIGAALMRAGAFSPEKLWLHKRLLIAGAVVGLPIAVLSAVLPHAGDAIVLQSVGAGLNVLAGPFVALGYLAAATLLAAGGLATLLTWPISRLGRMALTNYLLQTLTATFLMYHWGLSLFGTVGHAQMVGIVLAIYAAQLVFSAIWLRFFLIGPMEWLWRTGTYLRPQRLRRNKSEAMV